MSNRDQEVEALIKKYSDQNVSADPKRIELFRSMSPLTKELLLTTYGSFENFMNSHDDPHPFEEYYISVDENMFEDNLVATIARRMGITITRKGRSYERFVDDVISLLKKSGFTKEEYRKYINMTEKEYGTFGLDYEYDDRLFAFMKHRQDQVE